jgi:peptide/nickel transport system permease protein
MFVAHSPIEQDLGSILRRPSFRNFFGTDQLGRDIFARVVYGARSSLWLCLFSILISLFVGVPVGSISGYYAGKLDLVIMRISDVFQAFPRILLALAIVAVLGPSQLNIIIAVGLGAVPIFVRLSRGLVLQVKEWGFVEATRAVGSGDARILIRHILPNIVNPILVQARLSMARALLAGAALSFLGMGAQPPTPEWGLMVSDGRLYLRSAPHVVFFPGLAILITVLSFNIIRMKGKVGRFTFTE